MIILNDAEKQCLVFEHPRVKVVNVSRRFPNLGAKRNHAASLASGELLLTWGDDDIHLPHRIERMVGALGSRKFLLEGHHFILTCDGLKKNSFPTTGAHIVRRDFYWAVGGVPEMNTGEDAGFNKRVQECLKKNLDSCQDPPAFIYRWHSPRPHISAFHRTRDKEDPYKAMLERSNKLLEEGLEPEGRIILCPHWKKDYLAEATRSAQNS